jgi:hypothetical protein
MNLGRKFTVPKGGGNMSKRDYDDLIVNTIKDIERKGGPPPSSGKQGQARWGQQQLGTGDKINKFQRLKEYEDAGFKPRYSQKSMDPFRHKRQVMGEKKLTERHTGDVHFGKEVIPKRQWEEVKRSQGFHNRRDIEAMTRGKGIDDPRDLPLRSDFEAGLSGRIGPGSTRKEYMVSSPHEHLPIPDDPAIFEEYMNAQAAGIEGMMQDYGKGPPPRVRAKIYQDAIDGGHATIEHTMENEQYHLKEMLGEWSHPNEGQTIFWEVNPGDYGYEYAVKNGHVSPDGRAWYSEF